MKKLNVAPAASAARNDRRLQDEPGARDDLAAAARFRRRLGGRDPAEKERGREERDRVRGERERRRNELHQQAAETWSAHKRECPAAVQERVPFDVAVAGDDPYATTH